MKYFFSILCLSLLSATIIAQHEGHESVLNHPENWKEEIIPFPIGFAQEIDLVGFEELRFSPGWNDSTSTQFWMYMFVWYVEPNEEMTVDRLTRYMEYYYDGLMGVGAVDENGVKASDRTICDFRQTDTGFAGSFNTFDHFFTKERITLYVEMTEHYCAETGKKMYWFEVAKSKSGGKVWEGFDEVKATVKCK